MMLVKKLSILALMAVSCVNAVNQQLRVNVSSQCVYSLLLAAAYNNRF